MTNEEKIDYMIQSLQIAKEEITYAKTYKDKQKSDKDFYNYGHMGYESRTPNGTIIRESLRMVGRMANIVANDISLSPYCSELFKGNK